MDSKFSLCVATPVYNGVDYLERLAMSIVSDPDILPNFTWLVRDDGSTDGSLDKIREIATKCNINFMIWTDENKGLTYSRNFLCEKFLTKTKFTHMVFIDADDYFNPGWFSTIHYWLNKVSKMFPEEKSPYLCFKYWNDRESHDECQIYTKLNTRWKHHAALCQYSGGGVDLLHVIPREYLIEVKEFDGNYYHVEDGEKWTPDGINFMNYLDYKASFISDMVASLGVNNGNMSDTYYDNVVTKYAKGQVAEMTMFMNNFGGGKPEFDWNRVPGFRYRWYLKCLLRMIANGTLVFSGKKWADYTTSKEYPASKPIEFNK